VVGSGVIADLGLIVTGDHLVKNAEAVNVALSDGRCLDATVLVTSEGDDLAVLRIAPGGLAALSLGDASGLEVGDFVLAIGNALGAGRARHSVSSARCIVHRRG
jgi:S1-C subfamily serine protease